MKTHTITISITPDELEILGGAVEQSIKKEIEAFGDKTWAYEEELDLLRELVNIGYAMWLNPTGKIKDGKLCRDVDEWLAHIKKTVHNKNKEDKK
jgi:hypothetical protein